MIKVITIITIIKIIEIFILILINLIICITPFFFNFLVRLFESDFSELDVDNESEKELIL